MYKREVMNNKIECDMCGTCCTAYSISSLNKKAGEPCKHLLADGRCGDYENRPQVCRDFQADFFCYFLSSLSKQEQIEIIKELYDA